eukprot:6172317-Pleurochrysis_carterae.AAC.2
MRHKLRSRICESLWCVSGDVLSGMVMKSARYAVRWPRDTGQLTLGRPIQQCSTQRKPLI